MKKMMVIIMTVMAMMIVNVNMIENVSEYILVERDAHGELGTKVTVEEGVFFNKTTYGNSVYRNREDKDYGKANWEL